MIEAERAEAIRDLLAGLQRERPGFARRRPQDQMIVRITKTLEREGDDQLRIIAAEAPTGVGKSLAYLVAALLSAKAHGKTLLISTATVALQQQVMADLAVVEAALGASVSTQLVKGRGRYLCDRNAKLLSGMDPDQATLDLGGGGGEMESPMESRGEWPFAPTASERDTVTAMEAGRRAETWNGDLDTWTETITPRLKSAVTTTSSGCAGPSCSKFARCPVMVAKAAVWKADVLVTNHALLLADLALGHGALLPEMSECVVVIDEAHHLPEAAVSAFACAVSLGENGKRLRSVERVTSVGARLLGASRIRAPTLTRMNDAITDIRVGLQRVAQILDPLIATMGTGVGNGKPIYGRPAIRRVLDGEIASARDTLAEIGEASKALESVLEGMRKKLSEDGGDQAAKLVRDLASSADWVSSLRRAGTLVGEEPDASKPPVALWLERMGSGDVVFHASGVDASGLLVECLWKSCYGAVLTSATLTTFGSFDHFARRVGLSNLKDVAYTRLPSPFDLESAAVLSVPWMSSLPTEGLAYVDEVVENLASRIDPDEGTLVLFASGALLKQTYDRLPVALQALTTRQGDLPIQALLAKHRALVDAGGGSILFGLATLAEGVDLPGRYNSHTVIVKLPFPTPDDPLIAAHSEWLDARGVNAFSALFLPEAYRRVVQSCGRLIRTATDRGRITILDQRLMSKPYGRRLLEHLPPYRRDIESAERSRAA